jgi:hypothetical protein
LTVSGRSPVGRRGTGPCCQPMPRAACQSPRRGLVRPDATRAPSGWGMPSGSPMPTG